MGSEMCIRDSGDTYQIIILMSDGLSSDRQDDITNAELFTINPYHIVVCIGVGRRIDYMELIQLANLHRYVIGTHVPNTNFKVYFKYFKYFKYT